MKQRTIAAGADLMAFVRGGSSGSYTYTPIAGQQSLALTVEDNDRESNAKNLGGTVDYYQGLYKYSLTVEADIIDPSDTDADEIDHEALLDYELAHTKIDIVVAYVTHSETEDTAAAVDTSKPAFLGRYRVAAPINAGNGENATTSLSFKGCQIKLQKITSFT